MQGAGGAQGPGARARPGSTWTSTAADSHSIQYQNANNSVRVTDEFMQAVVDDADWSLRDGDHRRGGPHAQGPRPVAPDQPGRLGVRGSRHAVRHHDQPLAHGRQHRAHQRLEPLLRVHAPRQLGVQPGQPQPAQVPARRRELRHRRLPPCGRGRVHRPGDPGRPVRLPDRVDRRHGPPVPPAGPRLRQPRRPADGARPALRHRRRAGLRRRRHVADDRPRLRGVGPDGVTHGPVRRLRREPRAHAPGARPAPGGGRPHRRGAGAARPAVGRPGELGLGVRAGRRLRRAQQPGLGAGPDRHDRPDDGLRHHRHRARPRAGQAQEAGGGRHDVDRQPDRAPGARAARLRAG